MSLEIEKIRHILLHDGVIAYPTETVYGIGCDPQNQHALQRINQIKGRQQNKGFIVISSQQRHLQYFSEVNLNNYQNWLENKQPTSLIVPCKKAFVGLLTGNKNTIAIRLSKHPVVEQICQSINSALVSTSLNQSGKTPVTDSARANALFGPLVDMVVSGECGKQAPSRIIDAQSGTILRP